MPDGKWSSMEHVSKAYEPGKKFFPDFDSMFEYPKPRYGL